MASTSYLREAQSTLCDGHLAFYSSILALHREPSLTVKIISLVWKQKNELMYSDDQETFYLLLVITSSYFILFNTSIILFFVNSFGLMSVMDQM